MFSLRGKKALVTGSTQGIGYAIAKAFLAAGAEVIIHGATSEEKTRRAAEELGATRYVTKNLCDPDCAAYLKEKTGNIDILVLNASIQYRRPWDEISPEEFDTQIACNLKATLALMQAYTPAMKTKKWGRIITVGSVQEMKPHPQMAVYAASKCAQLSLVKNIAKQLAPFGITVNNLVPGVIATPRNDGALSDPAYREKVLAGIPVGYAGEADDCAPAALFLASGESRYVTGSEIVVDGGMSL